MQNLTNATLATVAGHIGELGLQLAVDKTQVVVFRAQYGPADLWLQIQDQAVQICATLRYLGVVHESKRGGRYGAHFRSAADKARRIMAALNGLMPNIGGPRESKKRLLTSVVYSVMLYGAPTWGTSLLNDRRGVNVFAAVQRSAAISSVSAYRTVSYEVATDAARMVPINLIASERHDAFEVRRAFRTQSTDERGVPTPGETVMVTTPAGPQSLRARTVGSGSGGY